MKIGRFDYVKYDDEAVILQAEFKQKFEELEQMAITKLPGRAGSLVLTRLEEAYMWVGKGVRDWQLARSNATELQEKRCDS